MSHPSNLSETLCGNESRDKLFARMLEEVGQSAALDDATFGHQHHVIAKECRFTHIVRYQHYCLFQLAKDDFQILL